MKHISIGLTPEMQGLLSRINDRVVIVGGLARTLAEHGDTFKDMDLLWDANSRFAERNIRSAIRESEIEFTSLTTGHWTFDEDVAGVQVEILPLHHGPSYATCKRSSYMVQFDNVWLPVAEARHCPKEAR